MRTHMHANTLVPFLSIHRHAGLCTWKVHAHMREYIEGFQPEWCISTIYHAWDALFWSGTLDIQCTNTFTHTQHITHETHIQFTHTHNYHRIPRSSHPLQSVSCHTGHEEMQNPSQQGYRGFMHRDAALFCGGLFLAFLQQGLQFGSYPSRCIDEQGRSPIKDVWKGSGQYVSANSLESRTKKHNLLIQ